ncbi:MAG TPA: cytochrome c-type biogenesis protein CcmH [Gemmatimonadales bacterium]
MSLGRRAFLAGLVLGGSATERLLGARQRDPGAKESPRATERLLGARRSAAAAQQAPLPGQGEAGTLRDPVSAGRSQPRATHRDNDPFVTGVEKRLHCTCGCTLDIYTCRTTDFTCTYSPALHREVLALEDEGKSADEIVAAFVDKYGEKILMAPKPEGFNIAGYVVPGLVVLLVGAVMFAVLRRRTRMLEVAGEAPPVGMPPLPGGAGAATTATTAELERLERELKELDQ